MSTSDQVRAILGGTVGAYRADPAYRQRPDVHNELDRIGRRLNQPIRIALAGTLKAGKSTLVNALVGEDIAPTDATEATRIVTWFRNGPTPKVTANHRGGRRSNVPIARNGGQRLETHDQELPVFIEGKTCIPCRRHGVIGTRMIGIRSQPCEESSFFLLAHSAPSPDEPRRRIAAIR